MTILKIFYDHLLDFFSDLLVVFPNDNDIKDARKFLIGYRKINPKQIKDCWKYYITDRYKEKIYADYNEGYLFLINKNYDDDLVDLEESQYIAKKFINQIRGPLRKLDEKNRKKTMDYIKNICKLSELG
tara:strand:+ start:260 stop:646 length:387 start_codon:yes stop_codon:yes gene_type:complete